MGNGFTVPNRRATRAGAGDLRSGRTSAAPRSCRYGIGHHAIERVAGPGIRLGIYGRRLDRLPWMMRTIGPHAGGGFFGNGLAERRGSRATTMFPDFGMG